MKKILLAIILLAISIAVSENILMENHPRMKTTWLCDKQLWNRKVKRIPWKDISSKVEESLSYDDSRQFPRISDTRFISESRKLPMAVIRQHDLAQFSQRDLSSNKPKVNSAKPRVLISIGIQEDENASNLQSDIQEDCSRKNGNTHNQGWQIQQPFYVEEPRIEDPEQLSKMIEDYKATLEYLNKEKGLPIKIRVRRSDERRIMTNEGSQSEVDEKDSQIKERNYYNFLQDMDRVINNTSTIEIKNRSKKNSEINTISKDGTTKDTIFIENYGKNVKNLAKRLLRGSKSINENQISANDIMTDFVEEKQEIQRKDISNDIENGSSKIAKIAQVEKFNNNKSHYVINKRNKRSILSKNQELYGIYKDDANSKTDVEKNETYKQNIPGMKLETKEETKNEEDKFESNKDHIGDSQLTSESNSKNSETKISRNREKRNVCKNCKLVKLQYQQDEWLKNIEKKIRESLSLERRDKHSDILERLSQSEPYIISRGKKAPQDFEKDNFSLMSNSRYANNDESYAKMMTLPIEEGLLRMLLMRTSRCNNNNCDIIENWLSDEQLSPRDRRGTLDEIFAAYDPYYVARGKRTN
ncbi:uncharacterized protein LOC105833216 isoform X2 [Monomorium pharaonis]|uniref:uncharacterized protein LOC105833216 isoform X2 n=1 Tax=Monomorium pharaonis TaxID=307658 RepID=UPI00063EDE31|nr:uncharacterized protein LOC105833216 isoform X2 [Monomorium pharaonis]